MEAAQKPHFPLSTFHLLAFFYTPPVGAGLVSSASSTSECLEGGSTVGSVLRFDHCGPNCAHSPMNAKLAHTQENTTVMQRKEPNLWKVKVMMMMHMLIRCLYGVYTVPC